jgi:hypothetical protein
LFCEGHNPSRYLFFTGDDWLLSWHIFPASTVLGSDRAFFDASLHPQDHSFRIPQMIHHKWVVTAGIRASDGAKQRVYLIHGK